MKILFDHQIYNDKNFGGISRYFYELSKGLTGMNVGIENSIRFSENEFISDRRYFNAGPFISFKFQGRGRLKRFINQKIAEREIAKGKFDIFHPTYYNTYFLDKSLLQKPLVVTFHDLIHEKYHTRFPEVLEDIENVQRGRRLLLKSASKIIAVSESTKRDIVEHYGTDPEAISVIHLANSLQTDYKPVFDNLGDFILFVGNRFAYKNFDTFIRAIQPLLLEKKELRVICAGGGKFSEREENLMQSLKVSQQVTQVAINDSRLAELYQKAMFFVFPSLYEGFGIPVLEAFSCGCPIILSNSSSLPEVGGEAALYINPEDEDDILEKVRKFVDSPDLRNAYRELGYQQASKFSWEKTCQKTLAVYNAVVAEQRI